MALSSGHSSPKTRAEELSLSFDNLSPFRPPSPYLSPPASLTSTMSPPPRREAEEYLTSRAPRGIKKKRPQNGGPRRSPLIQSEELRSVEKSPRANTAPQGLGVRNCESCESKRNRNLLLNTPNPPSSLRNVDPQASGHQWQCQENNLDLTLQARAGFAISALQELEDLEDSPAINSLRRVSRSFTQNPESNLRDLRNLSRTLTDKLNSVFTSKDRGVVISEVDENAGNPLATVKQRAATMKSVAYGDDRRPLLDSGAMGNLSGGLNIPASITLRKASEALALSAAKSMDNKATLEMIPTAFNPPSRRQTSSKSLIAFRSGRVNTNSSPTVPGISFSHQGKLPSPQSDPSAEATSPESQVRSSKAEADLIKRFSFPARDQRRTSIAETALTFADFFPAPGTFVKPNSSVDSVSPEKTPFHFSIVRVLTTSSAHEIIWREDETSSSGGSSSLVSPTDKYRVSPTFSNPFESSSVEGDALDTTSFLTSASPEEHDLSPRVFNSESNKSGMDSFEAHRRFFAWTWDNANNQQTENEQTTPKHNRSRSTTLQANDTTVDLRKTSLPAVQSSPYLGNSCSVSEWHEEPIIKLDDTGSSRAPEQRGSLDGDVSTELDRGLAMFMRRSQKMAASSFQSPAVGRTGKAGSTGSLVGVSSHARVK